MTRENGSMNSANEKKMIFTDPETEKKIDELLAKMTLEEKIGQICQVGPSPVGGFEISEEQAAQLLKDKSISQATYDAIINHLSRR